MQNLSGSDGRRTADGVLDSSLAVVLERVGVEPRQCFAEVLLWYG
jgi:hypothetical protein